MQQHLVERVGRGGLVASARLGFRLLALLLLASPVFAADPVYDARGFDPEREFLSQPPYEHVDPMTGNLLLTFTDLVLPGNAGFDLRIQRTYNSKAYAEYTSFGPTGFREDSWAGVGWLVHFGRVSTFPALPSLAGPVVEMPDGSLHQAYPHMDGVFGHYITRDYWTYEDRHPAPVLRLPSGITYRFGRVESGPRPGEVTYWATEIRDPFGSTITIEYAPPPAPDDAIARVVQKVGTKTRTVVFTYDPTLGGVASGSLRSMTFGGRTWTFVQKRMPYFGYTALTEVRPPAGPSWRFEYNENAADAVSPWLLSRLTTPSGGHIDYAYAAQLFRTGSGAIYTPSLRTRTTSGPGVATGTWRFQYSSPDWRAPVESLAISPCGATVRYTFKPVGSYGAEEPWAIGSMITKETLEGATVLERDELTWIRSVPISDFPESGNSFATHVPLLGQRVVSRAGSANVYRTRHLYNPLPYRRTRAANFNDHGRPFLTLENGEIDRASIRTFAYLSSSDPSFGTCIVDRLDSETVLSGMDAYTRSYEYQAATGFRTSENHYGIVTRLTRDNWGNVASETDANGNVTRFTHDWGALQNTATPEYTVTRVVNADGSVQSETRRGLTTRFQYDALRRPTLLDPPIGLATRTEYDNASGRFTRTTRGSSLSITKLNGFEQAVGTENSRGVATTRAYDTCGRPVYEGYPFYAGGGGSPSTDTGTATALDGLGRAVRLTHPDGNFRTFEYRGIDVTITDENARRTVQDRSAFGDPDDDRLVAVTDTDGKTTSYRYNALGRLTRVEGPGGAPARRFVYNDRNELVLETHPEAGTVTFTYDPAGNLRTRTDPQFGTTTFRYDRNRRLVSVDRPGSVHDTTIAWDASDNRTRVANGHVDSQLHYDAVNRLLQGTDLVGGRSLTTTYAYDDTSAGNGNLKTLGYPTGRSVTYAYDSEGRVTSVKNGAKLLAGTFQYHASGGVASFARGNGVVESIQYDRRYRPVDIQSGSVLGLTYAYDGVGNVLSLDDRRSGMDLSFGYDALDRLTTANGPWGAGRFTYDPSGNRLSRSVGEAATTYAYDAGTTRLASAAGSDAGTFDYDRNGNLLRDPRGAYTHAPTNLMETADVSGQVSAYRYDGDDLRKVRTTGGETHYYVHGPGGVLLSELLEKGSFVEPARDYVYAGPRLIAALKPSPLVVTPATLDIAAQAGGPPTPGRKVRVETPGTSGIAFTVTTSAPWLTVSPVSATTPRDVTVAVDPAVLAAESHLGTVTVVAPQAQGSPKTVAVSVTVVAQPELQVTPGSLSFEATAAADAAPSAQLGPGPDAASAARTAGSVLGVPLVFERNRGQAAASVEFLARGPGYGLFLTADSVVIGLAPEPEGAGERVRMRFAGANPTPRLEARDEQPGRSHYYRGNDRSRWVTGVPQFAKVAYEQVYPGIDAVFYGKQRQLEYDLVVAAGADPEQVRLSFEGVDRLRVDPSGDLVLQVGGGEIFQKKPTVYQERNGARRAVAGRYRDEPLVIDPVLSYFTYLGGSTGGDPDRPGEDRLYSVAVDPSGATYVSGMTLSTDFPARRGGRADGARRAAGHRGGEARPPGLDLGVRHVPGRNAQRVGRLHRAGPRRNVFLAGGTRSPDFPTTDDAVQRFFAGPYDEDPDGQDVVVARIGADGALLFSTYFGGRGNEWAAGIGVDASGAAYVGGGTWSDNLPVRNPMKPAISGSHDAFVAKFRPSGDPGQSSLVWATYLGGGDLDLRPRLSRRTWPETATSRATPCPPTSRRSRLSRLRSTLGRRCRLLRPTLPRRLRDQARPDGAGNPLLDVPRGNGLGRRCRHRPRPRQRHLRDREHAVDRLPASPADAAVPGWRGCHRVPQRRFRDRAGSRGKLPCLLDLPRRAVPGFAPRRRPGQPVLSPLQPAARGPPIGLGRRVPPRQAGCCRLQVPLLEPPRGECGRPRPRCQGQRVSGGFKRHARSRHARGIPDGPPRVLRRRRPEAHRHGRGRWRRELPAATPAHQGPRAGRGSLVDGLRQHPLAGAVEDERHRTHRRLRECRHVRPGGRRLRGDDHGVGRGRRGKPEAGPGHPDDEVSRPATGPGELRRPVLRPALPGGRAGRLRVGRPGRAHRLPPLELRRRHDGRREPGQTPVRDPGASHRHPHRSGVLGRGGDGDHRRLHQLPRGAENGRPLHRHRRRDDPLRRPGVVRPRRHDRELPLELRRRSHGDRPVRPARVLTARDLHGDAVGGGRHGLLVVRHHDGDHHSPSQRAAGGPTRWALRRRAGERT